VDNASSDGTLERPSLKNATVLRNPENLGLSGAIITGMQFAIEHDYEWIWILDADSAPEPDALEKLLDLYAGLPRNLQDQTGFLACLACNLRDGEPMHGQLFTRRGIEIAWPPPDERYYPVHAAIWSGSLYRLAAVRQIGLPNPNYMLDAGDCEYGYRVMRAGYKSFIHQDSILRHNIRGTGSFAPVSRKLGPLTITSFEVPPIRCYYAFRNTIYFALYDFDLAHGRSRLVLRTVLGLGRLTVNFVLRPLTHGAQIRACFRGIWHGVTGNIAARY
jgi:GT2 family glycosyltransferase